ncbi:MAG: hypothetical protein JXR76_18655 [Deltaproteobacteria bacterium]|nr:hypothetical protein [Deltaproteobacteria bacterium]
MKVVSLLLLIFTTAGCTGIYNGSYLDRDHAYVFHPCPADNIEDVRQHAFLAIQSSLADTDWVIEKRNSSQLQIAARKCVNCFKKSGDFLSRYDGCCTSIEFSVEDDARISAVRYNKRDLYKEMIDITEDWIVTLERNYAELRCYSDELLKERIVGQNVLR